MKQFVIGILLSISVCLPAHSGQVPKTWPGLRGLWHFNEGSGTSVADATGNGNTGTFQQSPTWETSPKNGGRVRCGAVSNRVEFANETNFDFDKTNSFYMGVLFNRTVAYSNGEMAMGKMVWDSNGYRMAINQTGGINRPCVIVKSGANFAVQASSINMNNYLDGRDHSWIVTYDGKNTPTSWRMYIDGNDCGQLEFIFTDQTITGAGMLNNANLMVSNSVGTVEWYGAIDEAFIGTGTNVGAAYLGKLLLRKNHVRMPN